MKRNAERDQLLGEVLTEGFPLRASTLERGVAEMRRVQKRRRSLRVTGMVALPVVLLAAILAQEGIRKPQPRLQAELPAAPAGKTIPGTSIRLVNDEELFELFKGRPIAVVGPAGHQRFILLDEGVN